MHPILKSFCAIVREDYVLFIIIYTPLFHLKVWSFSVVFRFLGHFIAMLTIIECILTPYGHPQITMPWKKARIEEHRDIALHRLSVVKAMVLGEAIIRSLFVFLYHVSEVDRGPL